MCEQHNKEKI